MLAVGSKALFRLHAHDAGELAAELAAGEKNRYIRLLTTLERGELVVRLGVKRPVLLTVPVHRAAKPTEEELRRLKEESARRYTSQRSDIHRAQQERRATIEGLRGNQTSLTMDIRSYGDK